MFITIKSIHSILNPSIHLSIHLLTTYPVQDHSWRLESVLGSTTYVLIPDGMPVHYRIHTTSVSVHCTVLYMYLLYVKLSYKVIHWTSIKSSVCVRLYLANEPDSNSDTIASLVPLRNEATLSPTQPQCCPGKLHTIFTN